MAVDKQTEHRRDKNKLWLNHYANDTRAGSTTVGEKACLRTMSKNEKNQAYSLIGPEYGCEVLACMAHITNPHDNQFMMKLLHST